MNIELNAEQVEFIIHRLHEKGLKDIALETELTDHICCQVEQLMATGIVFHQSCDIAFQSFGENGMKEIQNQFIHSFNQKSQFMKNFSLAIIGVSIMILPFFIFGNKHLVEKEITLLNISPSASSKQTLKELSQTPLIKINEAQATTWNCPLTGSIKVSSAYGMRMHPLLKVKKMHTGVDFKAPLGTEIYAPSDGVVEKAQLDKTKFGNYILIKHDDVYQSFYAHLSELKVKAGQKIKKGDLIGLVGSTGMSVGPHLHYEIIENGKKIDPTNFCKP